ncbi:MAG: alanine racemase [Lentisphaeria bacterium]|nr:alanine racemase [Lentisphaeria bacterium]
MASRVTIEVDTDGLAHNVRTIRDRVAPCGLTAVLKANAYGMGVPRIAPVVRDNGAVMFGAATVGEAVELRSYGLPVQVLGNLLPDEAAPAVEHGIICPLNDLEAARRVSAEAVRQQKIAECAVAVDSGMGRLGLVAAHAAEEILAIGKLPNLAVKGIYSHFSSAGDPEDDYSLKQLASFKEVLKQLAAAGVNFEKIHIAASDGLNNFPACLQPPFTHARCGINLYGYYAPAMPLKEVVTVRTRIAAVRKLSAGSFVGYCRTHRLKEDTLVGTVAIGYADGVPLALSNRGRVLIDGKSCPILGRVSMDYITVSLNSVPEARCGDEVVCIGSQKGQMISAKEWADLAGTHVYDILCGLRSR